MFLGELDERIVCLRIDDRAVLDPAGLVLFGLHFEEAPPVLQNLERLAVHHLGYAIGDGRDPVVKIHLAGGNVHHLLLLRVKAVAAADQCRQAQSQAINHGNGSKPPELRDEEDWRMNEHSQGSVLLEHSTWQSTTDHRSLIPDPCFHVPRQPQRLR